MRIYHVPGSYGSRASPFRGKYGYHRNPLLTSVSILVLVGSLDTRPLTITYGRTNGHLYSEQKSSPQFLIIKTIVNN